MHRVLRSVGCLAILGWVSSVGAVPMLEFTSVPSVGSTNDLHGRVSDVAAADYRVAVFIRVAGGWWTKPTFAEPLTVIQPDGTWVCDITTGSGDPCATELAAFLVPVGFSPPLAQGEPELPSAVWSNAVAQVLTNRLVLQFSGYDWTIKDTCNTLVGPGPNYFSASHSNVWLDAEGRLHLRIAYHDGRWQCAEIVSQRSFGYGTYRFYVDTPPGNLDVNAVLGLFTWSDDPAYAHREIDVEMARWGNAADTNNAQFVVQPWDAPGHLYRYRIPPDLTNTTHSFTWTTNQVRFQTHHGVLLSPPATNAIIAEWTFTQPGVPVPGNENARINLWLFNGTPPADGHPVEVIISRFVFIPEPLPVPQITGVVTLPNGEFRLQATGEPHLSYVLQISSNLVHWSDAGTNQSANGHIEFTDHDASDASLRFYRLMVPVQ